MVTMTETVLGFILGLVLAILLSLLMSSFKLFRSIFYPFMFLSQTIPIIVVAPLITVWFGFGLVSKLIVCVLVVFFPIALNLTEGLSSYDKDLEELLMCMNASKFQIFMKLKLPSALVHFFSGLKIAAAYAVMGRLCRNGPERKAGLASSLQGP